MLVLTQHQGNEMNGFSSDEKKSETRKRNSNENDDDPMLTPGGDDTVSYLNVVNVNCK